MLKPWPQHEQLQLLLLIIQQADLKPNWKEISTEMGKTKSSVVHQYTKMKGMDVKSIGAGAAAEPAPATKERVTLKAPSDHTALRPKTNESLMDYRGRCLAAERGELSESDNLSGTGKVPDTVGARGVAEPAAPSKKRSAEEEASGRAEKRVMMADALKEYTKRMAKEDRELPELDF